MKIAAIFGDLYGRIHGARKQRFDRERPIASTTTSIQDAGMPTRRSLSTTGFTCTMTMPS
jgi:hypothetical protein